MPRPADQIFLRLAVKGGHLTAEDADGVWEELCRLEAEGEPTKARLLCLEFGFMDKGLGRKLKQEVRGYLERMAAEESRSERRIADFELIDRLSSGAMGSVYKARHLRLGKVVALKLLNPDLARDASYVARFTQEARAAATLDHASIVQAYDVGQAGDLHYIAMEFVDGKTLKELIERRGRLDEAAAVEITLQVLDALEHAHENSLIHRDVKPANIMITKEGRAKLLDLGLVRRTDVENGLTGEGKAIGTPYFMAPEQALDKGADYRADLYSLGGTLFNMVTGEKPYVAATPVAVMNMHLKAPIPDAHQVCPEVSTGLGKVIAKLLAKRPAERYQDHADLKSDLELVLHGFMPELRTGVAPAGIRFIEGRSRGQAAAGDAPRATSRRREAGSGGPPVGLLVGAAAAVLLIGGALLFAGSGGGGVAPSTDVAVDDPVERPDPREVEAAEREQAADALYGNVERTDRRRRVLELEGVANKFPETRAGRRARDEAQAMRREARAREEQVYERRSAELERLAAAGDVAGARGGYQALARELEDDELAERAEARARELAARQDAQADQALARAHALERDGKALEAAEAARRAAELLDAQEREEALARAVRLERRELLRQQELAAAAAARGSEAEADVRARLAELPATLRALVRQGALREALDTAEQLLAVAPGALREEVEPHALALRDAVALSRAALAGYAGRVGETTSLDRRKGSPVTGEVLGVRGDAVVVRLSERAELLVPVDELSETTLWRAARRQLGAKDPTYLRGVGAVLLYRGDRAAEEHLAKCAEAGVDLGALQAAMKPLDEAERDEPVAVAGAGTTGAGASGGERSGGESGASGGDAAEDDVRERYRRALDRNERARLLIAKRELLFPEADRVGYADDQLEPIYEFANGQEFGRDWRLVNGRSYPTPPGQVERYGLILEGRNGRAEFVAPIQGDVLMRMRFMPQMLGRTGRLALTLDDEEGRRVSNELGQLVFSVRRRPKAIDGASQAGEVRTQSYQVLELLVRGHQVLSKFNGKVCATIQLEEDLGPVRLGLEWDRVALNLLTIELAGRPSDAWVDAALEATAPKDD